MTLSREESFKKLDNMLEVHGYIWMRMAFVHLLDVGFRHFTKENIDETVKLIKERKRDEDSVPILTPDAEISLITTAAEFTQMHVWDVLEWARWRLISAGKEELEEEREYEEEIRSEVPDGCLSEEQVESIESDLEDTKDALYELRCHLDNAVEYLESVEEALDNIKSITDGVRY